MKKKAAGILFTDGKKLLLLRRSAGGEHPHTWSLPGGKAKGDETEINTAQRETKEESGLDKIPGRKLDSITDHEGTGQFTTFLYRVGEPFDVRLSHEHTDWGWFSFAELDEMDLHPKFRESLPDCLAMIRRGALGFQEWLAVRSLSQRKLVEGFPTSQAGF